MEIFGGLIEFKDRAEFNEFLEDIDKKNAVLMIEKALSYATVNGLFTLEENFAIYNCLESLKNED